MYTTEETEFMAPFHGNYSFPFDDLEDGSSYDLQPTFWPNHDPTVNLTTIDETTFWPAETTYPSSLCPSQMSSHDNDNTLIFHNPTWANNDGTVSMDISMSNTRNSSSLYLNKGNDSQNQRMSEGNESNGSLNEAVFLKNHMPMRWASGGLEYPSSAEDEKKDSRDTRKRSRAPGGKIKRKLKSKKIQRLDFSSKNDEDSIAQPNGLASSTSYSDDLSSSPELKGGASSTSKEPAILNLNGKTRASRGSATDPQSLYARVNTDCLILNQSQ